MFECIVYNMNVHICGYIYRRSSSLLPQVFKCMTICLTQIASLLLQLELLQYIRIHNN